MRVLMVASHFGVSIARYLADGFEQAGCEVITAGPAFGRYIPWNGGMELAEEFVWTPTYSLDRDQEHSIADVLSLTGRVDLIVHGDCMFHLVGDNPVPNVVYCADNHVREYREREYDLIFAAHSWGHRHEDKNFRWLPCAYDLHEHYEWQADWDGRVIDAGFVGVVYPNRQVALDSLRGWGLSVMSATGKAYHESNDLYNVCKMGLCLSYNGDVPARVFENMAEGCIVLADTQADLPKLGLENGKQLLTFNSAETLRAAVDVALSSEGQAIAEAGKAWVEGQTWRSRAQEIIRTVFA